MILSIIVPVYNVELYIEECVKSIYAQGLLENEFEVILINDGSTDKSRLICEKLALEKNNLTLINQSNKGQSAARNLGIEISQGEYLYFIDSDDYLNSGYFSKLLYVLNKDSSIDFAGFDYVMTKHRSSNLEVNNTLNLKLCGNNVDILSNYNFNNGPCWYIFKKSILGKLRFEENRLCEDGLFTAQLLLKIKNGCIYNNKIYCYYNNNLSTVNTTNISRQEKLSNDMFYAANKFNDIINDYLLISTNKKALARLKNRQESYTFFAIVRYLKLRKSYSGLKEILNSLESLDNPAYPIKEFTGYESKVNKILISIFNNKYLLRILVSLNNKFNIINIISSK